MKEALAVLISEPSILVVWLPHKLTKGSRKNKRG
jgi:hypothetical protein